MNHKAKSIGTVLQSVLKDIDVYDNFIRLWILQNWDEVFDKNITRICRPVKFEGDVLVIEAISESWANELQQFKEKMIYSLNSKFNQLNVKDIKIV
ncbi:MAG: DUF721 domain-containing protein [Caldisericaceae bacterium]|nr:DUF721 domain-containing protein [Caldisericaceae bacterium]